MSWNLACKFFKGLKSVDSFFVCFWSTRTPFFSVKEYLFTLHVLHFNSLICNLSITKVKLFCSLTFFVLFLSDLKAAVLINTDVKFVWEVIYAIEDIRNVLFQESWSVWVNKPKINTDVLYFNSFPKMKVVYLVFSKISRVVVENSPS